ncbi:MAG TPA: S8 family serine peptidase, partial [Candidatus Saccharimonadales bacterium]|nr:S8 family serine peptidase [Candidatus Saccharimonadales bacterium]
MLKTKIKKSILTSVYTQEAFWLVLVIFASWALVAVRTNNVVVETNPPAIEKGTASQGEVSILQSDSRPTHNNSKKAPDDKSMTPAIQQIDNIRVSTSLRSEVEKSDEKIITKDGKTYPLRVYKPLDLPNDTYANQWWVEPTGMEAAWETPAGSEDLTIAIIDTGFGLAHQEFAGRWATNSGESGAAVSEAASKLNCSDRSLPLNRSCNNIDDNFDGIIDNESGFTTVENPSWLNCSDQSVALDKSCNRIDDDGNGLVDDWRGWDFSNYDHNVQAGETNPDGEGTTHGTMTAGVLGATGDNNVGIAGVNWHAKILPIQALDDDEYGDSLTVGESIYYAVDQGA